MKTLSPRTAYAGFFLAGLGLFLISGVRHVPGLSFLYQWVWLVVWLAVAGWAVWQAWLRGELTSKPQFAAKGMAAAVFALLSLGAGYKALPWTGESLWFYWTSSRFEGSVADVHNDESADGGIRRTFSIQRHDDCTVGQYVSRDLVIPPWVSHDDSARTRESMAKGLSFTFREAGTRRFKNDMPLLGNFLWLGYVADFSSWPIIYGAEKIDRANPCKETR